MRHAGPLTGTERQAPCHISVRQGSGAKGAAGSGGGAERELGTGLRYIGVVSGKGDSVSISGTGVDVGI